MSAKSIKILLIEAKSSDANLVLDLLKEIHEAKPALSWVKSLSEGLVAIAEGNFEVVLLASNLLDSGGLIRIHSMIEVHPPLTFIILTERDDECITLMASQAAVEECLAKGKFLGAMLSHSIQRALERRRIQQELSEKNQELEDIIRNFHNLITVLTEGILIVDENRKIKYANPVAQDILGFQVDVLAGIPFNYPVGIDSVVEAEIPRNKFPTCFVEFRATSVLWERKVAQLVSIRDITTQKWVMNALLQSEKQNRAMRGKTQKILDNTPAILVGLDGKGYVTFINKKGREALGYEEKDILGKKWYDNFIPPRCRQEACSLFNRILTGEMENHEYCENKILTREGEERLISWHNTCLKDEEGKYLGIVCMGEDITGRACWGAL